jgi:hypothetical protein
VTSSNLEQPRGEWKRQLEPTSSCIPLDRLGDELTPAAREHVAHCVRCQTEMTLWREYESAGPAPAEGAVVQWIVAEIRRRTSSARTPRRRRGLFAWLPARRTHIFAIAAATLAVLAVIYVAQDREPAIRDVPTGGDTYRTASIDTIGPAGDLDAAPTELQWNAMSAAARYDVQVEEVDRTVLWRESTSSTRIALPGDIITRCVPGKTILWRVAARDGNGAVVAESGTQRFRVRARPSPGSN